MQDSLDLRALRDIGLTHETMQAALRDPRPGAARLARIVEIRRDHAVVHDGHALHDAIPWPALRVALDVDRETLVVGDWVWWQAAPDGARGWVVARLAPRNRLTRRDPAGGRQGLVANIDAALVVMGLDADFNLRRLDRFLVLAHSAPARAVIVLSKADRCADPAAAIARVQSHLRPAGATADAVVPDVVAIDGRSDAARATLAPWLVRGSTLVMLGSSGAGKTTLTNTLAGTPGATQAVRESDGRGQHTTTARTLHRTHEGSCLIDTPGLRQLWLDADAELLQGAFPEIGALALHCRYRDCRHQSEPGCAVCDRVAPERLESFQKLLREARRDQLDVFERRRQASVYKQRARASRERLFVKTRS